MKKLFLLLVCLYGMSNCTTSTKTVDIDTTISINLTDELQTIMPDSIFSQVKYITLETNDNSIISEIDKLCVVDSLFYIFDRTQECIMVFDENGKFKSKLQKQGRGIGEYLSLDDFFIKDSLIYVLSSDNQKLYIYDREFNFISDLNLESFGVNITYLEDLLFYYTDFSSSDFKRFRVYDLKEMRYVESHHSFPKEQANNIGSRRTIFTSYKDSLFAFIPYEYSIYSLSKDNGTTIKYELDFGEENMYPPYLKDATTDERNTYLKQYSALNLDMPIPGINNLYIGDKFIYFSFVKARRAYQFFKWNDIEKYGYIITTKKFPAIRSSAITVNEDEYVCYQSPEVFMALKEYGHVFPDNINKMKYDDNPVICIYKFKENE